MRAALEVAPSLQAARRLRAVKWLRPAWHPVVAAFALVAVASLAAEVASTATLTVVAGPHAGRYSISSDKPCTIGPVDLSLWLLRAGLAQAEQGAPARYREAETEAKAARRGMWAEGERTR